MSRARKFLDVAFWVVIVTVVALASLLLPAAVHAVVLISKAGL